MFTPANQPHDWACARSVTKAAPVEIRAAEALSALRDHMFDARAAGIASHDGRQVRRRQDDRSCTVEEIYRLDKQPTEDRRPRRSLAHSSLSGTPGKWLPLM